ncbi:hypothetical protein F2P81_020571 [Scophthalmus maximus]|uniref:Uncharacterized protein n=1 Tax=Scophthalmus maximus TaxID=52904 RepID=A0A6A4S8D7_SCOMX|nr:hypothetical protein F2P81_020571 [Scophthalmus maximus]
MVVFLSVGHEFDALGRKRADTPVSARAKIVTVRVHVPPQSLLTVKIQSGLEGQTQLTFKHCFKNHFKKRVKKRTNLVRGVFIDKSHFMCFNLEEKNLKLVSVVDIKCRARTVCRSGRSRESRKRSRCRDEASVVNVTFRIRIRVTIMFVAK